MRYFLLSVFTAVLDLTSKEVVKNKMPVGQKKQISKKVFLWHIKNKGLAYNKFENDERKVLAVSSLAVGAVGAYLFSLIQRNAGALEKTGSALLLGGGIGNLVDRIKNKNVTDFIYVDFKKAPIFNVADIAALFGGILVVFKAMIDEI